MTPRNPTPRRWAGAFLALAAAAVPASVLAQAAATGPNPPVRRDTPGVVFMRTKIPLFAYAAPTEASAVLDEVTGATVLTVSGCGGGWCRVVAARSKPTFIRQELLERVVPQ